jgi:hypothetical protein
LYLKRAARLWRKYDAKTAPRTTRPFRTAVIAVNEKRKESINGQISARRIVLSRYWRIQDSSMSFKETRRRDAEKAVSNSGFAENTRNAFFKECNVNGAHGFGYVVSNGEVAITGYTGNAKDITIPGRIDNLPVTAVGDEAFAKNQLTSITIPDGVTSIGEEAFFRNRLTSVSIPNSVTAIGDHAFARNRLTSVTIPDGVAAIGEGVFRRNRLTGVSIPYSVTTIGDRAFARNRLTSIAIPANADIQASSFYGLVYEFYMASGRKAAVYTIPRSVAGDFEIIVSNDAVEIVRYCGEETDIVIPEKINNLPVTVIGGRAFLGNKLLSVTIPGSVTSIGNCAFYKNRLTGVTIPDGVASIAEGAFAYNRLTSVTIPDGVTAIGKCAFSKNRLTSITIPNSVTTIGTGAFYWNQLTSITIPADVDIQRSSFYGLVYALYRETNRKAAVYTISRSVAGDFEIIVFNNAVEIIYYCGKATDIVILEKIDNLPVTAVGYAAFLKKELMSVTIPDSVTAIGQGAFAFNQLTNITIPDGVTSIEVEAFAENQLTSVTIPDDVTSIESGAFMNNLLTSVIIPNSVTAIGVGAFWHSLITSVTIPANVDLAGAPFSGNLTDVYQRNGKRAGTYISGDGGKRWRRKRTIAAL